MPTTTQEIPRLACSAYFGELTTALGTVEATVEVVGSDVGDQITAERLILTDMGYDDKDDVLIVGLEPPGADAERVEHQIADPQRILVATGEAPPLEMVYDIEDGEHHQWLIRLERPPALPGD
jgi:hypothetical protein